MQYVVSIIVKQTLGGAIKIKLYLYETLAVNLVPALMAARQVACEVQTNIDLKEYRICYIGVLFKLPIENHSADTETTYKLCL